MDGAARLRLSQALLGLLQAVRRTRARRDTDRLLVLLGGIAHTELRLHRLGEHLRKRTPEEAAWTIAHIWDRVAAGDPRAQEACLGLLDSKRLSQVMQADQFKAVQAVLEADGDPSAGLFQPAPSRPDSPDNEVAPRPKEPVGFRISLARSPTRKVWERLLFDSDVRVIRTILGNPRLTETEVVNLAASRRVASEVLEVIAQDDRWIARYPVKVALANNPTTPLRVVVGLLPYLLHQDLRAVAGSASRAEVRERAASLLSRRSGG